MDRNTDFGSIITEILKYGGSTFAALVATSIYTVTDEIFIGHALGIFGLAAMGVVYPVTLIATALTTLAEVGSSAVVAEAIGKGDLKRAESLMRGNYFYLVIFGTLIAIISVILVAPILDILSAGDDDINIIIGATDYLHISLLAIPFMLVVTLTQTFMRCIDKPGHVLYLLATTSLTNIVLDAILILLLDFGLQGAAAATLLAQVFGAAISFWYFKFSKQKFKTSFSICELPVMFKECQIGLGFAIIELTIFPVGFFVNAIIIEHNAPQLLAAASIINVVLSLVYLPLTGLDTGVQPLVSRLYAAKKFPHLLKVMKFSCFVTTAMTLFMFFIMMFFVREISEIFVAEDVVLTDDIIDFVRYGFVLYPFVAVYTWLLGLMAALEDTWRNIFISVLAPIAQITIVYILSIVAPIEMLSLHYSIIDLLGAVFALLLAVPFLKSKGLPMKKIFTN